MSESAIEVTTFDHVSGWREPRPSAAGGPMHVLVAVPLSPHRPRDFTVWQSMRERERGMSDFDAATRARLIADLHSIVFDPFTPREVTLTADECRAAERRIDEWLVASMERLANNCEIAGAPLDKRERFMFSAGTGTGATPGPEHSHWFTLDDYRGARSRVLAAKVAASDAARTEAARRVVLGPIDDESEV